jgi:hypothetical protein
MSSPYPPTYPSRHYLCSTTRKTLPLFPPPAAARHSRQCIPPQHLGVGQLTGAGQAGEEDRNSLEMSWHVAPLELRSHFGKGEPAGSLPTIGIFCHTGRFSKVTLLRYIGASLLRYDPSDRGQFFVNQLIAATPQQSPYVWHIF